MKSKMRRFIDNLNLRPPARENAIAAFEKKSGHKLPAKYREFLKISNGGEGSIGNAEYIIL
jgi:hypothetical protein